MSIYVVINQPTGLDYQPNIQNGGLVAMNRDRKPVPQQSVNPVFQIPPLPPQHSGLSQHAHTEWRTVDDNELAADFDGSLSGLGMDLAGIPYNMRSV